MKNSRSKGIVKKNIQTPKGMLYKDTKIRIEQINKEKACVTDVTGRLFWVNLSDILV